MNGRHRTALGVRGTAKCPGFAGHRLLDLDAQNVSGAPVAGGVALVRGVLDSGNGDSGTRTR